MSLTPLSRLGDYILMALMENPDAPSASPEVVVDRIRREFASRLTSEDLKSDPSRPDDKVWESRVYLARRYLGDDQFVLSNRREWTITEAGKIAAAEARRRLDESRPPVTQTPEQRSLLQPSVIATPLLDPDERARIGLKGGDDAPLPVMIELRLSHPGGAKGAFEALQAGLAFIWGNAAERDTPTPRLDWFDEYVRTTMSITEIRALVGYDQNLRELRAIHRIWPDFPVEALIDLSCRTVKIDAARRSFAADGAGITWAVIDSGIDQKHPHFATYNTLLHPDVAQLHRDFTVEVKPEADTIESALTDERGHGTHVAGIIAGGLTDDWTGQIEVITEQYLETDDQTPMKITRDVKKCELSGMAPMARLVSLKVLPKDGPSDVSRVMAALRYVREVNAANEKVLRIHGVNLSLGYEFDPKWFACGSSPICTEVDRLVRTGVVVVVAAGNTGYGRFSAWERQTNVGMTMTINDPGNAERAITVGSTHRTSPHTYGVSYFSSKGPTGDGRLKPDLIAPGERITSCSTGDNAVRHNAVGKPPDVAVYSEDTGTSFAAPHVSGAIAAFLSVRPEFVAQPEQVKDIFVRTATSLGRERYFEGSGLIDLMRALQSI